MFRLLGGVAAFASSDALADSGYAMLGPLIFPLLAIVGGFVACSLVIGANAERSFIGRLGVVAGAASLGFVAWYGALCATLVVPESFARRAIWQWIMWGLAAAPWVVAVVLWSKRRPPPPSSAAQLAKAPPVPIDWKFAQFADLTPQYVHDLYRLRAAVFVVEQNCVFQDVDGVDPQCWHLLGYGDGSQLLAYCRLVPAGIKFPEPSIGRVITALSVRRAGMGRVLMAEAMKRAARLWPGQRIRIGAQAHLERFYNGFGFTKSSEPYDEDGILHIEMETGK